MITKVTDDLYRGPQPGAADVPWIVANIRTVIRLERDKIESTELAPASVVPAVITPWQIYFAGISQTYLAEILGLIEHYPKPVFAHCLHGQDRTGLIVAAYRVAVCGWKPGDAWAEALHFGYRHLINFGLNRTWVGFVRGL